MRATAIIRLFSNARVWTGLPEPARSVTGSNADVTAIIAQDGRIAATGVQADLERQYPQAEVTDLGGRLVTPGLIDCHTHIVHGGNRAEEIARRLSGESYQSIARSGGGILSTVRATRTASEQQLIASALHELLTRVDASVDFVCSVPNE